MNNQPIFYRKISLFLLLFFCFTQAWAGNTTRTLPVPLQNAISPPIEISDSKFMQTTNPNNPDWVAMREATVRLFYGREGMTDVEGLEWSLTVEYELEFPNTNIGVEEGALTISTSGTTGVYEALNLHNPDMDGKVKLTVTNITATLVGTPNATIADLPSDIHMELNLHTELYEFLDNSPPTFSNTSPAITDGVVELTWNGIPAAEEYELEWAFVDIETLVPPTSSQERFANSSNIIIKDFSHKFTMAYPPGTVYFRLRPIGRFIRNTGNDYSRRKYGAWSAELPINSTGFELDQNWQYSITFAEDGKNKKVVNYFDDGMRSRQSQTNLSTEGLTLVAENMYDTEGRPSVNFLPVPKDENDLFFKPSFNMASSNESYQAKHFDKSKSLTDRSPDNADNTTGAAKYFSANNNFDGIHKDYIPSAEGYPFTQVEFTHDGTGRVRYQGGIGENYQIYEDGSTNINPQATRYYYGSATETEMRRLFGSNIGEAAYYRKNLVVDPNGQGSVSYVDQTGQTVATALAGQNPANVLPLDNDMTPTPITLNLQGNNEISIPDKISRNTTTLLNTNDPTTYSFVYELAAGVDNLTIGSQGGPTACASCKYQLEIWATNTHNQRLTLSLIGGVGTWNNTDKKIEHIFQPDAPCTPGSSTAGIVDFELLVTDVGEFTIHKELRLVEGTVTEMLTDFSAQELADLEQAILDDIMDDLDYSVCAVTCEQRCVQEYLEPGQTFEQCWAECNEGANPIADELEGYDSNVDPPPFACRSIYQSILNQIQPGGWLHTNDVFLAQHASSLPGYTELPNGSSTANVADDIRDEWLDEWAEVYAPFHPEYCHFEWCSLDNTAASELYDMRMAEAEFVWEDAGVTNFWARAQLSGNEKYLDLTSIPITLELDPYFANNANPFAFNYMKDRMESVVTDPTTSNCTVNSSLFDLVNCPAFYSDNNADAKENWRNYRAIYAALKKEAQAVQLENQGCQFAEGENTIVVEPYIDGMSGEVVTSSDFYEMGLDDLAAYCGSTCEGRVDFWLHSLAQNCALISEADMEAIKLHLETFCIQSCMDLSNPLGYITTDMLNDPKFADNYPVLAAIDAILDSYSNSCFYETYDTDDTPINNPLSIEIFGEDIQYVPVDVDNFSPDCEVCDIVAAFIEDGEWEVVTNANGVVTSAVWVPGHWDIAGLQAYFGVTTPISPIGLLQVVENCMQHPDFNTWLASGYHPDYGDLSHGAGALINFLGCNPNIGPEAPDGAVIFQSQGDCVCETLTPYFDSNAGNSHNFDLASFNADFNLNISIEQALGILNLLEFNSIDCTYAQGNTNFPAYEEASFPGRNKLPCKFNPMMPTTDFPAYNEHWADEMQADCIDQMNDAAAAEAQEVYQDVIDLLLTEYLQEINQCFNTPFEEDFAVSFDNKEHHYTLYYYDQAGNLIQTVPPQGVVPMSTAAPNFVNGRYISGDPEHTMKTRYRYNTLGQIIWQYSPDGGETKFYYDDIQRLRLSQNAQQAIDGTYSYTRYDAQSRIVEVGQVDPTTGFDPQVEVAKLTGFLSNPNFDYEDVTYTDYDEATNATFAQNNLRGRVAQTSNDAIITSYDYDIHGNVRKLQHNVIDVITAEVEYDYDLISGNVKEVTYQKGKEDEFHHRYEYDADNRLTNVETSDKGYIWDQDARYFYYQHGPLARAEIGHDKVQGLDYFYTLQGWIKGVNMLGKIGEQQEYDPGRDGSFASVDNERFGRDQMAYYLGYNTEDYTPIGNVNWSPEMGLGNNFSAMYANNEILGDGLYNGNIALMATYIPALAGKNIPDSEIKSFGYQYDQLHRIRAAKSGSFIRSKTKWGYDKEYDTNYTYDANGNILSLDRSAEGNLIDQLAYNYDYVQNSTEKNQLLKVIDTAPTNSLNYGDLQTQSGIAGDTYRYDAIGNLTRDWSERIQNIEWTVYGKVKGVEYINGGQSPDNINFTYDAAGNRLSKHIEDSENTTTYYLRDASGNMMATYEHTQTVNGQFLLNELKQEEVALYGSSRIGINKFADKVIESSVEMNPDWEPSGPIFTEGFKLYHLFEDLRISELQYESPLTAADATEEEHLGEYITLYNRGEVPLSLEGVELRSGLTPYVKHKFDANTVLQPKHSLIVAYGSPEDKATFQRINGLGEELEQPDINWYWQTDLRLQDDGDFIVLRKVQAPFEFATNGLKVTVDLVEYGTNAEISYDNEVFDPASNSPDLRTAIYALSRKSVALIGTTLETKKADEEYRISVFLEGLNQNSQTQQGEVYEQVVNSADYGFETSFSKGTHTEKGNKLLSLDSDFKRERGDKLFELSNHLGNVLATVSDKLRGIAGGAKPHLATHYLAEVRSASDYYPFGLQQYGRKLQPEGYRYGFNGKENDSEWGSQVIQDYGFRIYNPSLGKFLSVDPLSPDYPELTPYQFASNTPVQAIDADGLEKIVVHLLDRGTKSLIGSSRQNSMKKGIENRMSAMNVDLKVEFVTHGDVMSRTEFENRDGAHWSDSYILVGSDEALEGIDFDGKNWQNPLIDITRHGAESYDLGKSARNQFFALISPESILKIIDYYNDDPDKKEGNENLNFFSILENTIEHESGHPKFKYHPKLKSRGTPGHIDDTIMAEETHKYVGRSYDEYMNYILQKLHGKIDYTKPVPSDIGNINRGDDVHDIKEDKNF